MAGHSNIGSASTQSFGKAERLNSKKLMDELFNKGSSFVLYPFRIYWMKHEQIVPSKIQVLISVPKKNFPLAVDRNRIKRLMREAYRKNKLQHINSMIGIDKNISIAFLFTDRKVPEYKLVEEKMISVLNQLAVK